MTDPHDFSEEPTQTGRCRECGCTDDDCSQCVEKTGEPCYWVESDLCSACQDEAYPPQEHLQP